MKMQLNNMTLLKSVMFLMLMTFASVAVGQHAPVMRNKGTMFVGTNAKDSTEVNVINSSLYIGGTATFSEGSAVNTSELSIITLTGDFVGDFNNESVEEHVFTNYNMDSKGATHAKNGAKGFMLFANNLKNPVYIPSLQNPAGEGYDLNLATKQTIKMTSLRKDFHYLSLPAIYGQKVKSQLSADSIGTYVAFDHGVAIASSEIKPSVQGVVSIEGKYAPNRRLDIAFVKSMLMATPGGKTNADMSTWQNQAGVVVRDIKYYNPTDKTTTGNSNILIDNGLNDRTYALTGFTPSSPYLYADHMFFNVLTRPENGSFTGWKGPVVDPLYEMKGGQGYFIAQNVIPLDDPIYADIIARHSVDANERAVGGYIYGGRELFLDKITGNTGKQSFNKFTKNGTMYSTSARPYIGESLGGATERYESLLKSTYGGPIKIELNAGMNYLGNPFTTPLDLGDFVNVSAGEVRLLPTDWGTSDGGQPFSVSPDMQADIRGTFWVVNGASIRYFERDGAKLFAYKANYWDAQQQGGTIDLAATTNYNVGPMQMFVLQTSKKLTLTLPASKTTMENVKTTRAAAPRKDELLFQAVVFDKDDKQIHEDRLALVLHEKASVRAIDAFDSRKLITNIQETKGGVGEILKNAAGDAPQNYGGILYSKSSDGVALSTNVLPTTMQQISVFFEPTKAESLVKIKPYRFETWDVIKQAWLEDKYTNKFVELKPDTEYEFTSAPLSSEFAGENRFVVHINKLPAGANGQESDDNASITANYSGSTVNIFGLKDQDRGSTLQIYDMQGRLMGQTSVTTTPRMEYGKNLSQGAYILKLVGQRNSTTKFVAL